MRLPLLSQILVLVGLAVLTGCAAPAETSRMTVLRTEATKSYATTPFYQAMSIAEVTGGEATNPAWTSEVGQPEFAEALKLSLQGNELLAKNNKEPKFALTADLQQVDQPLFGLDLTVTSAVLYRVVESATKAVWFDELVKVSYTAKFSDSVLAVQRLQYANEGSIKKNIRTFLDRLVQTKSPVKN